MGGAVADVTNLFMPSDCRLCHAAYVASPMRLGGVRVCEACLDTMASAAGAPPETLCARCGEDFGMESARFAAAMGLRECTMCRLAPPEFARAIACGTYDNEIRELLHLLKFDGQRRVAEEILGEQLAAATRRLEIPATELVVVVPVPLFKARQRERGFNQAEVLARAAMKALRRDRPEWKLSLRPALERVKDTRPLYRLDPRQRRRNLKGAFRIADRDAVRGREVLLIDDIMTTGATARECSAVLLRAGAAKVWVVTVARAQPTAVGQPGVCAVGYAG